LTARRELSIEETLLSKTRFAGLLGNLRTVIFLTNRKSSSKSEVLNIYINMLCEVVNSIRAVSDPLEKMYMIFWLRELC
jgi:hypothetical protein